MKISLQVVVVHTRVPLNYRLKLALALVEADKKEDVSRFDPQSNVLFVILLSYIWDIWSTILRAHRKPHTTIYCGHHPLYADRCYVRPLFCVFYDIMVAEMERKKDRIYILLTTPPQESKSEEAKVVARKIAYDRVMSSVRLSSCSIYRTHPTEQN